MSEVVAAVSHIQRIGCQPERTTLYGDQSRSSWSAIMTVAVQTECIGGMKILIYLTDWIENKRLQKLKSSSSTATDGEIPGPTKE